MVDDFCLLLAIALSLQIVVSVCINGILDTDDASCVFLSILIVIRLYFIDIRYCRIIGWHVVDI